MRLIDADALLKVFGFTEDCTKCKNRYNDMLCESVIWRDVCDAIFEAPTADAVPVVRCKDCKWKADTIGESWCDFHEFTILSDDDYCSYGERQEVDTSTR